jgi:hypothetical protein
MKNLSKKIEGKIRFTVLLINWKLPELRICDWDFFGATSLRVDNEILGKNRAPIWGRGIKLAWQG